MARSAASKLTMLKPEDWNRIYGRLSPVRMDILNGDTNAAFHMPCDDAIGELDPQVGFAQAAELSQGWHEALDFSDTTLVLLRALGDSRPLACAYLQFHLQGGWRVVNVNYLTTQSDQRGNGFGSALLETAAALGSDRNCEAVTLLCDVDNNVAFRFYTQRHGYITMAEPPAPGTAGPADRTLIKFLD